MSGVDFPVRAVLDDAAIKKLAAEITKTGKAADMSEKEIKDMNDQLEKTGTKGAAHVGNVNKSLNNMVNDGLKKVGAAFLAAFALDKIISLGKQVVDITAEFQKFEAVLTNALGSKSAAQIGMAMLEKFAAKTPFAVQELTSSYVKLVNQGFIPTEDELRKLGDLSASTGKQFDQLTEAIIDAQTGEFERLKEFGIRASKEGDKVTFTFKGVQTQTEFTSESIREYILSLGDAAGVSGSMAAISERLGGGISNMGDAYDHFLETLGDGQKGPLQNAVKNLTALLAIATEWVKTDEQLFDEQKVNAQAKAVESFKAIAAQYEDINLAAQDYLKILDLQIKISLEKSNAMGLDQAKERNALEDKIQLMKAERLAVEDFVKANQKKVDGLDDEAEWIENIFNLQKKLKDLQADQLVQTGEQLAQTNVELEQIGEKIKALKELGLVMTKLHNISKIPDGFTNYLKQLKEANSGVPKPTFGSQLYGFDPKDAADRNIKSKDLPSIGETVSGPTDLEDQEELKRQILQETFDLENMFIDEIEARRKEKFQNEMSALEAKRDFELSLAEGNAEAQERINKAFDEKQRAMRQKQAEREKRQAIFNILNSTAQGVMSALATSNVPLSIFVAAMGVIQAGIVATREVPKFAKGVFRLKGPGTATSDSINARLSAGETVIPTAKTNKFPDILKEIVENPTVSYTDIKRIVDSHSPTHLRDDLFGSTPNRSGAVESLLKENNQRLKEVANEIAKNGRSRITIVDTGEQWRIHERKRYSAG